MTNIEWTKDMIEALRAGSRLPSLDPEAQKRSAQYAARLEGLVSELEGCSQDPNALHVPVWVVLQEGHRPYVSTVEHTPGYYQALKAAGHTVVRAEIEIPGYVIDDGKVQSRTVKE